MQQWAFFYRNIDRYLEDVKVVTKKSEDQAFAQGLKQGDPKTLEKIYVIFSPPIRGFITQHGGNSEDAKDIFQEGIMVIYRMVQKPDFKLTSSFLTLLFPICRNLWFKSIRKRPFYEQVQEDQNISDPLSSSIEDIMTERTIDRMFRSKVSQLGDQCQTILQLFFEGTPMKDIVLKLKLSSISFAKKKKFQCKEELVKMVRRDPIFKELNILSHG